MQHCQVGFHLCNEKSFRSNPSREKKAVHSLFRLETVSTLRLHYPIVRDPCDADDIQRMRTGLLDIIKVYGAGGFTRKLQPNLSCAL